MAKDGEHEFNCEFFEEAGGTPPKCAGKVTKAIHMRSQHNPNDVDLLFACEAHAAEFMREPGFLGMEPHEMSQRLLDNEWKRKLESIVNTCSREFLEHLVQFRATTPNPKYAKYERKLLNCARYSLIHYKAVERQLGELKIRKAE